MPISSTSAATAAAIIGAASSALLTCYRLYEFKSERAKQTEKNRTTDQEQKTKIYEALKGMQVLDAIATVRHVRRNNVPISELKDNVGRDPLTFLAQQMRAANNTTLVFNVRCNPATIARILDERQSISSQVACIAMHERVASQTLKFNSLFNELVADKLVNLGDYTIGLDSALKLINFRLYDNYILTPEAKLLIEYLANGDNTGLAAFIIQEYQRTKQNRTRILP
jgi:hypothetical protein